jgi:tetratricopeptide (TPR) repeat protein
MYLRTPKRYRPGRRRNLRLFSGRTVLILVIIPALVYGGWLIWQHQGEVRSEIVPRIENAMDSVQTQVAPEPTPTATPDVMLAQSGCTNAYRAGDLEEAIVQCKVLAESYPNDVDLYYRITHMLIITSNLGSNPVRIQEALDFAERAVNADPEAPHGWAIRAMALDWNREYGPALSSALHAKALDSTFAPTYAFLGEIYQDLGQYEQAWGYLEQALDLDTSGVAVADTFRNQGLWYSNQGDWEDAIQPYQAALQNAPNHTYIAIELAYNYIALGEIDQAIAVLSAARERAPTDTSVLFGLANAYWRDGDYEGAYEYFRRCLDVNPDDIPCLSFLGGLQFSQADYVTASVNLERAITLGSTDPDDYYQLGHAQASLGRCDLAEEPLRQGYRLASENEDQERMQKIATTLRSCGKRINDVPTEDGT